MNSERLRPFRGDQIFSSSKANGLSIYFNRTSQDVSQWLSDVDPLNAGNYIWKDFPGLAY